MVVTWKDLPLLFLFASLLSPFLPLSLSVVFLSVLCFFSLSSLCLPPFCLRFPLSLLKDHVHAGMHMHILLLFCNTSTLHSTEGRKEERRKRKRGEGIAIKLYGAVNRPFRLATRRDHSLAIHHAWTVIGMAYIIR